MLKVVNDSTLSAIGDAIRSNTLTSEKFLPSEMAPMISDYMMGFDQVAQRSPVMAHGTVSVIAQSAFAVLSEMVTGAHFSNCETVGASAFYNCQMLSELSLPQCRSIGTAAFASCHALSTLSLPLCETISNMAFLSCRSLTELYAPVLTTLGTNTNTGTNGPFQSCVRLSSVHIPNVTMLLDRALCDCSALTEVSIPNCMSVGALALYNTAIGDISLPECVSVSVRGFDHCSNITSAYLPKCTYVGDGVFSNCRSLVSAYLPSCSYLGAYAFWSCLSLPSAVFPECVTVGSSAFRNMENVTSFFRTLTLASFPKCTTLNQCAFVCQAGLSEAYFPLLRSVAFATFWGCSGLASIELPNCWSVTGSTGYGAFERAGMSVVSLCACRYIGDRTFMSCYSLTSIYLLETDYVSLASQRALWSTPMSLSSYTGSFGSIYVPDWMLQTYKSMTNWSAYSSRFIGMSLSTGSLVSAFSSFDLISPNGASVTRQSVDDGEFDISTFSAGHEGFAIEISGLTAGKEYVLEFTLQFVNTTFFATTSYCVGYMVTADLRTDYANYSQWPNNLTRDNNSRTYRKVFKAVSSKAYWSFALDGLQDRNNFMNVSGITVRESEWVA